MKTVDFDAPWMLAAAAVVAVALSAWLVARERRRARDLHRFATATLLQRSSRLPNPRRRAAALTLAVAAVAAGLVALARPAAGTDTMPVRRAAGDVVFLLDLSHSMDAADVAPSRLEAAKAAARAIAAGLPDDRVGLIVFGGAAFLQLPPTLDHSTFDRFVEAATTLDVPDPATNFEPVAELAAATFARDADTRFGAAVLLSDGEDVEGKSETAIDALRAAHLKTFTVGVGTPVGSNILDRDASGALSPHLDYAGREVHTRLAEGNLERVAERTGGKYVRWSGPPSVKPIVDGLSQLRRRGVSSRASQALDERFQWPLALALAALVASTLLGDRRLRETRA